MMTQDIEHLFELDPVKAHERIMQATRPPPVIVHKEYRGTQPSRRDNGNGDDQPISTDDMIMIDAVAQALAETRNQLRDEFQSMIEDAVGSLTEEVAMLQGQMSVIINLINTIVSNNGNGSKMIEAETKTTRKVRVRRSESTT
jgi:hypothetical protein